MDDEKPRLCKNCRKPMTSCKFRWNPRLKFCSKKCANRYNGKKRRGVPQNRIHRLYTPRVAKDTVMESKVGLE